MKRTIRLSLACMILPLALLGCTTDAAGSLKGCTESGFHLMFLLLALMLTATGVLGAIWGPRTEGMSLEEIQEARRGRRAVGVSTCPLTRTSCSVVIALVRLGGREHQIEHTRTARAAG